MSIKLLHIRLCLNAMHPCSIENGKFHSALPHDICPISITTLMVRSYPTTHAITCNYSEAHNSPALLLAMRP